MRIIADLHIHTKYSRATSKAMDLPTISKWARRKGINLVGTGDFTHPAHFKAISEDLAPLGNGFFVLKGEEDDTTAPRFMLTTEISNIYAEDVPLSVSPRGRKTRKVHSLIFAPSIEAVRKINTELARRGNVNSDGRPIFGFTAKELLKIALNASPDCMLIPAHAWTPWFSIFGSKSGFDTIEECFGDMTPHIFAIETGLSSDPQMNRRVSMLDNITLISNSDAHSPAKLGREATIFEAEMDYLEITGAIKKQGPGRLISTIEFFPEEGKYHSDGHRDCGVMLTPKETIAARGICPKCERQVTVGVLSRVEELADRSEEEAAAATLPSKKLVPLQEIIAASMGRGVNTKGVQKEYTRITDSTDEFTVLLDKTEDELRDITSNEIASAILCVRAGDLEISPGFDGQFGTIGISEAAAQRLLV